MASVSLVLYGIRNCDTVKKARAWLEARGLAYDFHDYKSVGVDAARLDSWLDEFGWEMVLNRAGTTFRKLPEAEREGLGAARAATLMLAQPSMIKRPILESGETRLIGFKEAEWAEALA